MHTPVSIREQRDSGSDDVRQVSNDTNSEGGDDSGLSDGVIVIILVIAIPIALIMSPTICPLISWCLLF